MKVVSFKEYQCFLHYTIIFWLINQQRINGQEEQAQGSIVVTLIYGVGIPWDVQGGYMTTGYAIRVPYSFPMKIKEWRPPFARSQKIRRNVLKHKQTKKEKQKKSKTKKSGKSGKKKKSRKDSFEDNIRKRYGHIHGHLNPDYHRWAAYKVMEVHASRAGLEGRPCVLRSICEVASIPFDPINEEWGELLQLLFTPSSSQEPLSKHSDLEYFQAEYLGKSGAPCQRIFKECKKSLLDTFTRVVDEEEEIVFGM